MKIEVPPCAADSLCSILTSPLGQSESPRLATAGFKVPVGAFVVQTPHQSGDTTPSRHAEVVGNKFLTIVYLETEKSVGVQTSLGPPLYRLAVDRSRRGLRTPSPYDFDLGGGAPMSREIIPRVTTTSTGNPNRKPGQSKAQTARPMAARLRRPGCRFRF